MSERISGYDEIFKEWEEIDEELRELRRKKADWDYIRKLDARVREAVELYIEWGDFREAQRISGLSSDEFVEVLRRAGIWTG